jgi:hypothetical protein
LWPRPLAFPAKKDNPGSFGVFQVGHVGVESYEPMKSGRLVASESTRTGLAGEGVIRGGRSYGNFNVDWTLKETPTVEDVINDNQIDKDLQITI